MTEAICIECGNDLVCEGHDHCLDCLCFIRMFGPKVEPK